MVKPRRHIERRFWTLDDPHDPHAKPVPPELVPTPGDGVHDGEEDNFPYAVHPGPPFRFPGGLA